MSLVTKTKKTMKRGGENKIKKVAEKTTKPKKVLKKGGTKKAGTKKAGLNCRPGYHLVYKRDHEGRAVTDCKPNNFFTGYGSRFYSPYVNALNRSYNVYDDEWSVPSSYYRYYSPYDYETTHVYHKKRRSSYRTKSKSRSRSRSRKRE